MTRTFTLGLFTNTLTLGSSRLVLPAEDKEMPLFDSRLVMKGNRPNQSLWISDIRPRMNQYEKAAVVAFRVLGVTSFIWGFVFVPYCLTTTTPNSLGTLLVSLIPAILYVVFGAVLFKFSKSLAAIVLKNLE